MKYLWDILKRYAPWLLLLMSVNGFSALFLWLSDLKAFHTLLSLILLFSLLLFTALMTILTLQERKKQKLFQSFLSHPDPVNEEALLQSVSKMEQEQLRLLSALLKKQNLKLEQLEENLLDYEEYVESWAHEAKTPLSLLSMLLENHADDIPDFLNTRLNYVYSQLQEDVTQMLYYARLKSSTRDYRFEKIHLKSLLEHVLTDYSPLLEEKGFLIQNHLETETVFTDYRGLQFMLGQIISNAIKYSTDDPMLTLSMKQDGAESVLLIADNGIGIKPHDLPYIFQKGFTGDSADLQKKATGMGLYLTRKMADDLNLKLDASSQWKKGSEISITFPRI